MNDKAEIIEWLKSIIEQSGGDPCDAKLQVRAKAAIKQNHVAACCVIAEIALSLSDLRTFAGQARGKAIEALYQQGCRILGREPISGHPGNHEPLIL